MFIVIVACYWRTRTIGSGSRWVGTDCAADWPPRHLQALIPHEDDPGGCPKRYNRVPGPIACSIYHGIANIGSIDQTL